jgi:hypothetical protein
MSIVVSTLRHYYGEGGSGGGGGVSFTLVQEGRAVDDGETIHVEDDVPSFSNNEIYVFLSRIRSPASFYIRGRGDTDPVHDDSIDVYLTLL